MTMYEAEKIIEKLAENKGLIWEKRKSITSSSLYYTLFLGKSSLMFRVSDHPTRDSIVTLRTDCGAGYKNISDFMEARYKELSRRSLDELLGLRQPPIKNNKGYNYHEKQKNISRRSSKYTAR